jgi:hypothetical protein
LVARYRRKYIVVGASSNHVLRNASVAKHVTSGAHNIGGSFRGKPAEAYESGGKVFGNFRSVSFANI